MELNHVEGDRNHLTPDRDRSGPSVSQGARRNSGPRFALFERATRAWWNPRFDSALLERQLQDSSFPSVRHQFQYALFYITLASLLWTVFFGISGFLSGGEKWPVLTGLAAAVCVTVFVLLLLTKLAKQCYDRVHRPCAVFLLVLLVVAVTSLPLLRSAAPYDEITDVGLFAAIAEILLLLYTVCPLPLYACGLLGLTVSTVSEVVLLTRPAAHVYTTEARAARALLHFALHVIGVHLFLMAQVRRHSTFLKIGQSLQLRKEHQEEKTMQEHMLHSLMPPSFAKEMLILWQDAKRGPGQEASAGPLSQPFAVSQMKDVSILFADIVGFTNMSSNKTAERLVELLNDLFGRFDKICTRLGCEKICTLGDCYYSVSGCPYAKPDHAQCCVELGLGMIRAIIEFDNEHSEQVQMRVGVHTGQVLCGIVGSSRFKYDVWSNDVTLANSMESTGQPARVHISQDTLEFVKDIYTVEEGEEIDDPRINKNTLREGYNATEKMFVVHHEQTVRTVRTYFITGRVGEAPLDPKTNLNAFPPTEIPPEKSEQDVSIRVPNDDDSGHSDAEDVSATAPLRARPKQKPITANPQLVMNENLTDAMAKRDHTTNTDKEKHLIRCIREVGSQEYFYKPPVNPCTLNFNTDEEERKYRHQYMQGHEARTHTLAHPRVVAFVDSIVSLLIFLLVAGCCFMLYLPPSIPWIVVFSLALLLEIAVIVLLALDLFKGKLLFHLEKYIPRHVVGALLLLLPAAALLTQLGSLGSRPSWHDSMVHNLILIVTLLNFCTFTHLSSWLKSVLATLLAFFRLVFMLVTQRCDVEDSSLSAANTTIVPTEASLQVNCFVYKYEIFWDLLLLLVLIWALNREFEIISRLGFHGDDESEKDKEKMLKAKNNAEWLLHNIIPRHVAERVKVMSKYSQQHTNVGVVFATITNFNDFYDESYKDGKEYLRVLNEVFWDFEAELRKPFYKDVEKIKTISSCFMAASGLDTEVTSKNKDPNAHLYALLHYCISLLKSLDDFNMSMINFAFEMNIGFNNGEVVAGVIGTTKLLYDIWGDAVNIASRMYSTGVQGRIQVPDRVRNLLCDKFEFEKRGQVAVKGKGVMDTYLVVKMKEGATWE